MHKVEPKAFLIAETMPVGGLASYLNEIKVPQYWDTDAAFNSEYLTEVASRSCYKSFGTGLNPNLTRVRDGNKEHIGNILVSGHGSVLEHASTTWAFTNVSRVFTHELVRHRAGCAISQESLRYVRLDDMPYWMPEALEGSESDVESLVQLSEQTYQNILSNAAKKEGVDSFDSLPFSKKKYYTSAARRVAPIGLATNIIWTANMRALRHVIAMRAGLGAEEEIRKIFLQVAKTAKSNYPNIFQDMFFKNEGQSVEFQNEKV